MRKEVWASPSGNDRAAGSQSDPLTLSGAVKLQRTNRGDRRIVLTDGRFEIREALDPGSVEIVARNRHGATITRSRRSPGKKTLIYHNGSKSGTLTLSGIVLDPQYFGRAIRAKDCGRVVVSDCIIRQCDNHGIDATRAVELRVDDSSITLCLALRKDGTRADAHGITSAGCPSTVIRNTFVDRCSGDSYQLERSRNAGPVTIRGCLFSNSALPKDIVTIDGRTLFYAGERVGENGVDFKQGNDDTPPHVLIEDTVFEGWRSLRTKSPPSKPGDRPRFIFDPAALNIKGSVHVEANGVDVVDSEIAWRIRGANHGNKLKGVSVTGGTTHQCDVMVNLEDRVGNIFSDDSDRVVFREYRFEWSANTKSWVRAWSKRPVRAEFLDCAYQGFPFAPQAMLARLKPAFRYFTNGRKRQRVPHDITIK